MNNTALVADDDTVCLPNLHRAVFVEQVLQLCKRYGINYEPAEDEFYHCCEAIAIALFMDGESPMAYGALRTFLNARGVVRFRGE